MSKRFEQRALLDRLDIIADTLALDALLERITTTQRPLTIAFLNQHAFNLYGADDEFRRALMDVDILLRDGIGISIALRALGLPAGLNMNGTDFIPHLAKALATTTPHSSVYAYGTASPWLERGASVLFRAFAAPPTLLNGFLSTENYLQPLRDDRHANKLVVLAMGMPKQEKLAAALKRIASGSTLIVCGGAILDFCAGRVRRAPRWVRAVRSEWLFRLLLEPRRLFSRYVIGGVQFLLSVSRLILEEKWGLGKSDPAKKSGVGD